MLSNSPNINEQNLKQQYNSLKAKIQELERQNSEMVEKYKAEEEQLIKSNEFLQNKNIQNNSKSLDELEKEVLDMRKKIQEIQNLIEQRNKLPSNLIESELSSENNLEKNKKEENLHKDEFLKNYEIQLKTEFENKLLMLHKELINDCIEKNNKIKEENGNMDDIIDIEEIKYFTIKDKSKNENKDKANFDKLLQNINETEKMKSGITIDIDKINMILSLLCMKEEYPKDFLIDYILDEAYVENKNKEEGFTKLLELERNAETTPNNEIQKFIQKVPKRKSVFHMTKGFSTNNITNKLCQLFEIKKEEDIQIIKGYINKIILSNKNNLRHYFGKSLAKYRFHPYEQSEKEKYDKKINELFNERNINIKHILKFEHDIISLESFEYFLKKHVSEDERSDDFIYYLLSLMKLTKNEKKEEKDKFVKSLGIFEFYLSPLFQKIA